MKQLISLSLLAMLFACTTSAEEDELSNNAAPAEDAGGATPDASVSDAEENSGHVYEKCYSISNLNECVKIENEGGGFLCGILNVYPVSVENGYCVLGLEPVETICAGGEILTDDPNWIWVHFNEDDTYTIGLVRENSRHPDWQYCRDGVDVPECACEGLLQWNDRTMVPLP